jgi:hypothetical protein
MKTKASFRISLELLIDSMIESHSKTWLLITQWDILSNGGVVQEMAHIANGRDTGNCVSLIRVNVSSIRKSFVPVNEVKFSMIVRLLCYRYFS